MAIHAAKHTLTAAVRNAAVHNAYPTQEENRARPQRQRGEVAVKLRRWYVRMIRFAHLVLGAEVERQECEAMIDRLESRRRRDFVELQYWRRKHASLTTGGNHDG